MMADWSALTNDMVDEITSLLPLPDQQRLSAVCHDWRLVAKQNHTAPVPELPWLLLGEDPTTKKRNFFNLSEQRLYSIDIPELYGQYVCGSSFGWLVTVDNRINGRLLNPFTRECYDLPPFPPYSITGCDVILTEERVILTRSREKKGWHMTFKDMQTLVVSRAVLSHDPRERSDFILMILFGECCNLAMWKLGDKTWTVVQYPSRRLFALMDVICLQGEFYAVSQDHIYAIDVRSECPKLTRLKGRIPSLNNVATAMYLVNLKGKLSLALRFKSFGDPKEEFGVVSFDLEKGIWKKLDDVGNIALFVGMNSVMVVDAGKFDGCVRNGIYFGDMCDSYYWLEKGHDSGVYNITNGIMGGFYPNDDHDALHPRDAALMWFTPNP